MKTPPFKYTLESDLCKDYIEKAESTGLWTAYPETGGWDILMVRASDGFMESFFHSMKSDVIHGRKFKSDEQLRSVIRKYMPFYNEQRLHSGLNYLPPTKFEAMIG